VAAELRARLQARGRGRAHTSVPIADTQAAVRSLWYEGAREREREREREEGAGGSGRHGPARGTARPGSSHGPSGRRRRRVPKRMVQPSEGEKQQRGREERERREERGGH